MSQSIHVAIIGKMEFFPRVPVDCFQVKGQIHEADVPPFALLDNFFPEDIPGTERIGTPVFPPGTSRASE